MPRAHAGGLLGGEDDVAVVGQQHDLFGAERSTASRSCAALGFIDCPPSTIGLAAELAEERLVALAGDHRDDDGALRRAAEALETLVARPGLLVHVVDLDLADAHRT